MKAFKLAAIVPLVLLSTTVFAQDGRSRNDGRRYESSSFRANDSSRGRYDNHNRYDSGRRYTGSRYSSYSRPYAYSSRVYRPNVYVSTYDPYYYDDYGYVGYSSYGYSPRPVYRPYAYYAPRYRSGIVLGVNIGGSRGGYRSSRGHRR